VGKDDLNLDSEITVDGEMDDAWHTAREAITGFVCHCACPVAHDGHSTRRGRHDRDRPHRLHTTSPLCHLTGHHTIHSYSFN
jgi:hypothetical protein